MPFCVHQPTDKLGITDKTNGGIIFPPNIPNNAAIHAYLTISDQLSVKTFLYFRLVFIPKLTSILRVLSNKQINKEGPFYLLGPTKKA